MEDLEAALIFFSPGGVTRGTGTDNLFCPPLFYFFHIMLDQGSDIFFHPCRDQGKTAAPFLPSQKCEIDPCLVQNLDKGLGDPFRHRKIGCDTPNEVDDLRSLFLVKILVNFPQGLNPHSPALVWFTNNVMDSIQSLRHLVQNRRHLSLLHPESPCCYPQFPCVDRRRTNHFAPSA